MVGMQWVFLMMMLVQWNPTKEGVGGLEPYFGYNGLINSDLEDIRNTFSVGLPFQIHRFERQSHYDLRLMVVPEVDFNGGFAGASVSFGLQTEVPWSSINNYGGFFGAHGGGYFGYIKDRNGRLTGSQANALGRDYPYPEQVVYAGVVGMALGPYFRFWDTVTLRLRFMSKLLIGDFQGHDIQMKGAPYLSLWAGGAAQLAF